MHQCRRAAPFFLQVIPRLICPLPTIQGGLPVAGVAIIASVALGSMVWRGYSWVLTLSILVQGLNVVSRLMMLFPHVVRSELVGRRHAFCLVQSPDNCYLQLVSVSSGLP